VLLLLLLLDQIIIIIIRSYNIFYSTFSDIYFRKNIRIKWINDLLLMLYVYSIYFLIIFFMSEF